MTTWNYRVVRHQIQRAQLGDGKVVPTEVVEEYAIHEVFYDEAGGVRMMSEDARPVVADTVEDLRWVLDRMGEALGKDVLEYGDHAAEEQGGG